MAFLGGAECSTAANPLARFSKHTQNDTSLQQDRFVGRARGVGFETMRSQLPVGQNDKMIDVFLKQSSLPQQPLQPFAMDQMRRELESFPRPEQRGASPTWATEFGNTVSGRAESSHITRSLSPRFGISDLEQFRQASGSASPRLASPLPQNSTSSGYLRPIGLGYNPGFGNVGMMNSYQPILSTQSSHEAAAMDKGKGRMVELSDSNWEQEFAQMDALRDRTINNRDHVDIEANNAIESELNRLDSDLASSEFLKDTLRSEISPMAEFSNDALHGDFDPWAGFDSLGSNGGMLRDPQLGSYLFEEDNFFQTPNVPDPYSEGLRIISEAGNLSLAALAFEAAVQREPSHIAAWTALGAAQAQNEKETPAIRALEQALKLDAGNLDALMGLAVSYTNEGYEATAYRTLERWLAIKYPQVLPMDELSKAADVGFSDRYALHQRVTELFIQAAQLSPKGANMDPDVQVGLGVLFYSAEDYEKAVDCFSAALESTEEGTTNARSQVHLLWNRLGATLANSGRSEEAITAYERALVMNPNFVRARYNLGISCINMGCLEEAAGHLLGALSMHAVVQQEARDQLERIVSTPLEGSGASIEQARMEKMMNIDMNPSSNLYETLRRVFGQMDRKDLADQVVPGMDVEIFRRDFEF